MPVLEVLKAATKHGAEIMGRGHELGTLAPGKLADVLVVSGDVPADISILEDRKRFKAVIQGGEIKAGQLFGRELPAAAEYQVPAPANS